MRAAALLVALAGAALGQTTVTPPQMRWGAPDAAEQLRLFAVGLDKMVQVHVGPGLRLELREGVPTLVAVPVPMVRRRVRLVRDANGNYPGRPDAEIFRNGILQTEGVDYTTNAGGILPIQPWAVDDAVTALFFEVGPSTAARAGVPCGQWWRAPGCCESLVEIRDCPASDSLAPPTVVAAAQIRNWNQVSARGVAPELRPGTLMHLAQMREGRWLLSPTTQPAPACRWILKGGTLTTLECR